MGARLFPDDVRRQLLISVIALLLAVPFYLLFLLLPQKVAALIALMLFVILFTVLAGPLLALMQRLVPNRLRARAYSVVMLAANLVGMGVGPLIVGMLSDALRPSLGAESLRYAMLTMSLVAFWIAYHLTKAARTVTQDLAQMESVVIGGRLFSSD